MPNILQKRVRFSLTEQVFFVKRLSFLVGAGVPLVGALEILAAQTKRRATQTLLASVAADVAEGHLLATALARRRGLLNDFSINLIHTGEVSGALSHNLGHLADELQKKHALRRKMLSALLYPACISVATLGIVGALTAYIFPKLTPIFASLHVTLPLTTRALMATSTFLGHWGILSTILLIVAGTAFLWLRQRYEALRYRTDHALLMLPLIGSLLRSYILANCMRTLALLLRSHITLVEAVQTSAETCGNLLYREALLATAESMTRGVELSSCLARYPKLFPDLCVHLCAIGEKTGNVEETLHYLAGLYENEVEELTKNLSSAVEPALMLVMGALVGLVAISVITPIYSITEHLGPK